MPDLLVALAGNKEPVLDLLEYAPFEDSGGPMYLRWHLDQYQFTSRRERSGNGDWWTSTPVFSSGVIPAEALLNTAPRWNTNTPCCLGYG